MRCWRPIRAIDLANVVDPHPLTAPSYFEMRQKSGGVTSVAGHRVESLEGGRSRLTLSVEMQGWLVPVVGLFSKGMTTRYMISEAQDMKRAAESAER